MRADDAAVCEACGGPVSKLNVGRGWRSLLAGLLCGSKTLCFACWLRWGRPMRGWARRWTAAAGFLAVGMVVVLAGASAEGMPRTGLGVNLPWVVTGLAIMLLGVAIRPSYARPPDPPKATTEAGP